MEEKEFFENYSRFVDSVTSDISKDDERFADRFHELSRLLNGKYARLDNAVAGLTGEAGEVADIWKKLKYHNLEFDEECRNHLIKELGDVCWYLMQTAIALDVPLDEVIYRNIEKLQKRHPHGFSPEYMKNKKED